MLRIVVLWVGAVWICLRLVTFGFALFQESSVGNDEAVASLSLQLAGEGLLVLALAAIIGVIELPGILRTRRVRALQPQSRVFLARANPEIRGLVIRMGKELSIRNGAFAPRMIFSVTVSGDSTGLKFWTGRRNVVGILPPDAIEALSVGSRAEGFYRMAALEIRGHGGQSATMLVVDDRPPLFSLLRRRGLAELVSAVTQLVNPQNSAAATFNTVTPSKLRGVHPETLERDL